MAAQAGEPYRCDLPCDGHAVSRGLAYRRLPPAAALALAAALAAACALILGGAERGSSAAPGGARSGLHQVSVVPGTLAASASAAVGAGARRFWPATRLGGLHALGGGVASSFTASGVALRVPAGTLTVSLASISDRGAGGAVRAAPEAEANRVVYRGAAAREAYSNGPLGLEQSFTVPRRPAGQGGPLVLSMRIGGSLVAHQDGSRVLFRSASGRPALTYDQLSVMSASGARVPASIRVRGHSLELVVADRGARFPLHIDPFFEQTAVVTGGEESGAAQFGISVALSGDGDTAIVGGSVDNGEEGAAWIFTRSGTTWSQQGPKLTGSGEAGKARFGASVAVSGNGNTAIVGGPNDDERSGAVWIFTRSGTTWSQQGPKLTGGEEIEVARFGARVALSENGETALVGGPGDDGGIGAAWVFTRSGAAWSQQGPKLIGVGAGGEVLDGEFGAAVALSDDGDTALIGGPADDHEAGGSWVFARAGETWSLSGSKLTATGETGKARFGGAVALSGNGSTALVGGTLDASEAGAAWVFQRTDEGWKQQGSKLTGGGEEGAGHFGSSVALNANGNAAIVGGNEDDEGAGAAWAFSRSGSVWEQDGPKVRPSSGEAGDADFGSAVAISAEGEIALVGGPTNGDNAGAVWMFLGDETPPPAVTGVSPSSGPDAGGTAVTITGSGFAAGATVTIGRLATSVTVVSPTEITAVTPEAPAGHDEVIVTDPDGLSSTSGPSFEYTVPPSVTSIKPTAGPSAGGTKLTIVGRGFVSGSTTVMVGSEATAVTVKTNGTKLTAVTAATAPGSYRVVVSTPNGTSTGGPSFTYLPPPEPSVTRVTPDSGPVAGGTTVTIKGANLTSGPTPTVDFGSVACTHFSSITAKKLVVTSPQGQAAGAVEVRVTTGGGTSAASLADAFTYTTPGPPTVTAVTPESGPTAGGTDVTIKGTRFLPGASVTIGNRATAVTVVSETEITATTSPTAAGRDSVLVSDADGSSTGGPSFTYIAPPTVTSIAPESGPEEGGTTVTINGTGFLPGATVKIGNDASNVKVLSPTEITAKTPGTPPGSNEVIVSDQDGSSTGGPSFTYVAPPTVTSITPESGPEEGGTTVTINGAGFLPGATVKIGNEAADVFVVSETEIVAITAGAPAGSYEVSVTDLSGTSTAGPSFAFEPAD